MSGYTRREVRHALQLELAIRETLDELMPSDDAGDPHVLAHAASTARIAALRILLKRAPDDEVFDAEVY